MKQILTSKYAYIETINQIQPNTNQIIKFGTIANDHQAAASGETSKVLPALTTLIKGERCKVYWQASNKEINQLLAM